MRPEVDQSARLGLTLGTSPEQVLSCEIAPPIKLDRSSNTQSHQLGYYLPGLTMTVSSLMLLLEASGNDPEMFRGQRLSLHRNAQLESLTRIAHVRMPGQPHRLIAL